MNSENNQPPAIVWWAIWAGILGAFVAIATFLSGRTGRIPNQESVQYLALMPLLGSAFLRFALLPRETEPKKRFVLFIVGLSLAEASGVLGIFMGGELKQTLAVLATLGIIAHMPLFLTKKTG